MPENTAERPLRQQIVDQCHLEPIRTPGKIQSHGLLFVLDESLRILQVSENCVDLLGREPASLLGFSILSLVSADSRRGVETLIGDAAFTYVNPFRVPLSVNGELRCFDGIAHLIENVGTVLELELDPSLELETAGLDNYLQIIQRSLALISNTEEIQEIADVMVKEVRSVTGFDRVMVYRFAPDDHGHVIAEAKEADMEPYLGLHYPASDIPAQARELYLTNPVRLLRDAEAVPAAITPAEANNGTPLDMSRSVLRSMSPVHIQYLRNMGVRASLSISLVVQNKLWGLIACHHRSPRFVSYAIRATVSLYAKVMSAQLDVKQNNRANLRVGAARREALEILTTTPMEDDPADMLNRMLPKLVRLFSADGALFFTKDRVTSEGSVPDRSACDCLQRELGGAATNGVIISHCSSNLFPSLIHSAKSAAGLVAIHLGGTDWLVMLRGEVVTNVLWAGNPNESKLQNESGGFSPRKSFESWLQQVTGESEPWPVETAQLTNEVRLALLEIMRRRNLLLSRSNEDLRRFAGVMAHEVKNHLQGSIMALSLIAESKPDSLPSVLLEMAEAGRNRLCDLAGFVDELLLFSGTGAEQSLHPVDLNPSLVEIVAELESSDLARGARIHLGMIPLVNGNETQLKHVFANLIRNALIHGRMDGEEITVEVGHKNDGESDILFVRDDGNGVPAVEREKIFDYFHRANPKSGGNGIGLAFCKQVVERMGQRFWMEDVIPNGTMFCLTVTIAREENP